MRCCPTSAEYLSFQQCINNVPTVFDLLGVIASQACGHLPLIEEPLPCPNMCQQVSLSHTRTEEEKENKGRAQNGQRLGNASGEINMLSVSETKIQN